MPSNKNRQYIAIALVLIISIAFILVLVLKPAPYKSTKNVVVPKTEKMAEPVFRKDGELVFSTKKKVMKTISIEIAQTDATREQGLMYRKSMPDSCGMLFIFDGMQPLNFWMKNTHLPLDIIYVDDKFSIVSIAKNAVPFSEANIPSGKDAMYVVEVNAGFTEKYHILNGSIISFTTK